MLWGDDGKPLGLGRGEAHDEVIRSVGQQQAKLYADCLEAQFGQRPVIFYTNGYETLDLGRPEVPAARGAGLLHQGRAGTAHPAPVEPQVRSASAEINDAIVERYYQKRAIRRIGEAFEHDLERKALLVMATGAGKTRTVIALFDLLMRCNWAKRILFLADRVALVNQAVGAFKTHLPTSSPVNLVTERHEEGRVYVSTYPTMMGLIDEPTPVRSAGSAPATSTSS